MSLTLSIDLGDATFADLSAVIAAAQAAGVKPDTQLELVDGALQITVDEPAGKKTSSLAESARHRESEAKSGGTSRREPIGEAAIKSVIDILTGRQEPPLQSPFGRFDSLDSED